MSYILELSTKIWESLPLETRIFMLLIVFVTLSMHLRFSHKAVNQGPTILTTMGIFATFFGIAVGLHQFDPGRLQESVPALLAGLKTAFWASVVGVACALTIKFRDYALGVRARPAGETQSEDEITAADLVYHLKSISTGLVGNEEGSLITQIKLARQDSNDRLDALKAAQVEALHKLSEMGSNVLIEALRDVIRDFNKRITEQFGENFKQLNAAVGQLLEWQNNYKVQIEQINAHFQKTSGTMEKATADYEKVVEKSQAFAAVASDLGRMLSAVTEEKEKFASTSAKLGDLLTAASGSLPEIEKKVLEMTAQLTRGVEQSANTIKEVISSTHQLMADAHLSVHKQVSDALVENAGALKTTLHASHAAFTATNSEQNKQVVELATKTKELISSTHQSMTAAQLSVHKQVTDALVENAGTIKTTLQSSHAAFTATNSEHNKHVDELIRKTKEQVTTLDTALSEELQKSLTSLGRQLSALSEKFVADYTPLTDRLKRVVELVKA